MIECFRRGLVWRGLIHDYSKYYPDEWRGYANFFEGPEQTPKVKQEFLLAWNRHCKRNDHHWQWWVQPKDSSAELKVFEMSEAARVEMLCDWLGVQKALHVTTGLSAWYAEREQWMLLGPKTKAWLKKELKGI